MQPPRQMLNNEQCACVDRILALNAEARELISKCKECGLDMDALESENNAIAQIAGNIKAKFAPNRP